MILIPCETSEVLLVVFMDINTSSSGPTLPYPLFLSYYNAGETFHQLLKHSPYAHGGQDGGTYLGQIHSFSQNNRNEKIIYQKLLAVLSAQAKLLVYKVREQS